MAESGRPSPGRPMVWLLICFIGSGASGLIYEVAWVRSLELVFGSTTFAVATVLAAFMGGLAGGSFFMGKMSHRFRRYHPLAVYGVIELFIAVVALCVPWLLQTFIPLYQWVWKSFHASFVLFSLMRLLLSVTILLLPTFLMGATLPIVSEFVSRDARQGQRRIGLLYAFNTLGAVVGCAAAGVLLFPTIGLAKTQWVGMALNVAAAAGAFVLASRTPAALTDAEAVPDGSSAVRRGDGTGPSASGTGASGRPVEHAWLFVFVYCCSGFVAMLYEVAWSRVLVLVLGSSTYAYTIMLATFLLGLAAGAWLAARWISRTAAPLMVLGLCQMGIALSTYFSLMLVEELPFLYLKIFEAVDPQSNGLLSVQFLLAFALMIIPTLGLGAMFPIAIDGLNPRGDKAASIVGWAYALNTVGAIVGSVLAGFWLVPSLGSQSTLIVGVAINAGLAALILLNVKTGRLVRFRFPLAAGLGLFGVAAFVATPAWNPAILSAGVFRYAREFAGMARTQFLEVARKITGEILMFDEGLTCTVTIFRTPDTICLQVNGKPDATTPSNLPNPFGTNAPVALRDLPTQTLAGQLPMMMASRVDDVLVVGLGSGITLNSVLSHPVKKVECIELENAVVRGAEFFAAFNHRPLQDPRTELIVNDARNHLLVTDKTYDVIISEPSNPWIPGAANLFTREFFELTKTRLRPHGVFCQWVQLYELNEPHFQAILRTVTSVFPNVHLFRVQYDSLLVATLEPQPLDIQEWTAKFLPSVRSDLSRIEVETTDDLLAYYWVGGEELRRSLKPGELNTDDNMLIEFAAPLQILSMRRDADTHRVNLSELFLGRSSGFITQVKLGPEDNTAATWARWAGAALRHDHAIEAETYATHSLKISPNPAAAAVLGEVLARTGRRSQATDLFRETSALFPEDAELHRVQSWVYAIEGDWHASRRHALRFLAVSDDPMAHYYLGRSQYHLGDYENALDALKHVEDRASDLGPYKDLSFYLASASWQRHRYPDAVRFFELYLKRNPAHLEARAQYADALYHLKRVPEAMAQWQRMGQLSSLLAASNLERAQQAWRYGQTDRALQQLEEAHRQDPWNNDVVLMFAQVKAWGGQVPAGADILRQYLDWNPDRPEAVGFLSEILSRQNRADEAELMAARYRSLTGQGWVPVGR